MEAWCDSSRFYSWSYQSFRKYVFPFENVTALEHESCFTESICAAHKLGSDAREGLQNEQKHPFGMKKLYENHWIQIFCPMGVATSSTKLEQTPLKVPCSSYWNHFWNEVTSTVRAARAIGLCEATEKRPALTRTSTMRMVPNLPSKTVEERRGKGYGKHI